MAAISFPLSAISKIIWPYFLIFFYNDDSYYLSLTYFLL